MQRLALFTAGTIFVIVSILHVVWYGLGIEVILGGEYHIPVVISLPATIISLILAIWMFAAARGIRVEGGGTASGPAPGFRLRQIPKESGQPNPCQSRR